MKNSQTEKSDHKNVYKKIIERKLDTIIYVEDIASIHVPLLENARKGKYRITGEIMIEKGEDDG